MLKSSYNISQKLKNYLDEIEFFRRKILLFPLSPKVEMRLKWDASLDRIYYSLNLSGSPLTKTQMAAILTTQTRLNLKPPEKEVIKYKKTFDYIYFEWLVSQKSLSPQTVISIFDMAASGRLRVAENSLKQVLDYIQISGENPVIQAGLAQIEITRLAPFTRANGRLSRLLSYLFLYKAGLDYRGLLVLEEGWKKDTAAYRDNINLALKSSNNTFWLEFFAATLKTQLEETLKKISSPAVQLSHIKSFEDLSARQSEILRSLEAPGARITNRDVQNMFGISQITASRDLARLVSLNLILPKGRGRSIYYSK